MITPWLALSLVVAAPRAPLEAELSAYVPKLEALASLQPFFKTAGAHAALLRPEPWAADAHPLLDIDVTDPDALRRVGIDPGASLTRSSLERATVSCVTVSDLARYRQACDARLARLGTVFEKVEQGRSVYATRDALDRVQGAYVLSGNESCAIAGHGRSIDALIPAVVKGMAKPTARGGFALLGKSSAPLSLVFSSSPKAGVLQLNATPTELTVDGRGSQLPFSELGAPGRSPFAALSVPSMVVAKAKLTKPAATTLVTRLAAELPGASTLVPLAKRLGPHLTGNTAAVLSHVQVTTGLRTLEARTFALKAVLLAEVDDAEAVSALVANAAPLRFREGTLSLAVVGSIVMLSNDAEVAARVKSALESSAGTLAHGFELTVDPARTAQGLRQIPLLEAVQAPELAGLVAASAELGPLLLVSKRLELWLDSQPKGRHTGRLTWELAPKASRREGASERP